MRNRLIISEHISNHQDCARSPFGGKNALPVGAVSIDAIAILIRKSYAPQRFANTIPTPLLDLLPVLISRTKTKPLINLPRAERSYAPGIHIHRLCLHSRNPFDHAGRIISKAALNELTIAPGRIFKKSE